MGIILDRTSKGELWVYVEHTANNAGFRDWMTNIKPSFAEYFRKGARVYAQEWIFRKETELKIKRALKRHRLQFVVEKPLGFGK